MRWFLSLLVAAVGFSAVAQEVNSAPRGPNPAFARGAKPSPPAKIFAAEKFRLRGAPPAQFSIVPQKLDMWGNNQYGDCVSAEEAFAKACYSPEIFIDAKTVVAWAARRGFRDGANLTDVMDAMKSDGFKVGSQQYNDGSYATVDYTHLATLQSAIAQGPVKIAIDANALPRDAGNTQGWYAFGGGRYPNTDHCTSLCGYGTASYCFAALNVPVPAGVDPNKPDCFLHFTWSTIGVVDLPWVTSTATEAWSRNPTTIGVPPLPGPTPPDPTKPTATLTASPTTIQAGQTSTLTWATTNAVSVFLNGQAVALSGSQTVTPNTTTNYVLLASGAGGFTEANALVTVGNAPPPGPSGQSVTFTSDVPKGIYELNAVGTAARLARTEAILAQTRALLDSLKTETRPPIQKPKF